MRVLRGITLLSVALLLAGCQDKPAAKTSDKTGGKTAAKTAGTAASEKTPTAKETLPGGEPVAKTAEPKLPDNPPEPVNPPDPVKEPELTPPAKEKPADEKPQDEPFAKDGPGKEKTGSKGSVLGALGSAVSKGVLGGGAKEEKTPEVAPVFKE